MNELLLVSDQEFQINEVQNQPFLDKLNRMNKK